MLLVLSPGTSTQWIPPRWLFGGPQNCETSPARPVQLDSLIHWFCLISSYNSYTLHINVTTSLKPPFRPSSLPWNRIRLTVGPVMKGLRNPRNGSRRVQGGWLRGILPSCPRRPWTLNFERCRCVHSFTPKSLVFTSEKLDKQPY